MAEPETRTRGRTDCRAIQPISARVVSSREARKAALRVVFQRPAINGSPARLTTASTSRASSSDASTRAAGGTWDRARAGSRVSTLRVWPACSSAAQSAWPMKPVPPVIRTCMGRLP